MRQEQIPPLKFAILVNVSILWISNEIYTIIHNDSPLWRSPHNQSSHSTLRFHHSTNMWPHLTIVTSRLFKYIIMNMLTAARAPQESFQNGNSHSNEYCHFLERLAYSTVHNIFEIIIICTLEFYLHQYISIT